MVARDDHVLALVCRSQSSPKIVPKKAAETSTDNSYIAETIVIFCSLSMVVSACEFKRSVVVCSVHQMALHVEVSRCRYFDRRRPVPHGRRLTFSVRSVTWTCTLVPGHCRNNSSITSWLTAAVSKTVNSSTDRNDRLTRSTLLHTLQSWAE